MKKLMNTRTNAYRQRIFNFLLENLEFEDHPELSDRQKVEYFFNEFERVANYPYNLQKFPNKQDRLADYLQGLPSSLSIPFANWEILELTKKLHGVKELTEKQEEKILKYYWSHIAAMLIRLKDKLTKK